MTRLVVVLLALVDGGSLVSLSTVPAGVIHSGCAPDRRATCLGKTVPPFKIDPRLVTGRQYADCVASHHCTPIAPTPAPPSAFRYTPVPRDYRWRDSDEPIRWVTFEQAKAYCVSRKLLLPSEEEWERAREEQAIDLSQLTGLYRDDNQYVAEFLEGEYANVHLVMLLRQGSSYRYGAPGSLGLPLIGFRCASGT